MLGTLLKAAVLLLGLYALVVLATYYLQRKLLYFPDPRRMSPASVGLTHVEELEIQTPDGERLIAWYGKASPGQPTLLYFHGNAGALTNRSERMGKYLERGRGMLMLAYRGYGGSSGHPSERANVADANLAYATLRAKGVAADDILLYGESLGSGIATQVAAANLAGGLILDAPYTSIVDVAERIYPLLPSRWLMTDRYETLKYIGSVQAPVLVIHGEADDLIPVSMGKAVSSAAKAPVKVVTFPGAGHSDHHLFGSFEAVNAWIDAQRMSSTQPVRREAR